MRSYDYMPWQYVSCLTVSIGEVTPNYSHRFLCAGSPHSQHWTGGRIFTAKEITYLAATTSVGPDDKVTVVQLQFHCQRSTWGSGLCWYQTQNHCSDPRSLFSTGKKCKNAGPVVQNQDWKPSIQCTSLFKRTSRLDSLRIHLPIRFGQASRCCTGFCKEC